MSACPVCGFFDPDTVTVAVLLHDAAGRPVQAPSEHRCRHCDTRWIETSGGGIAPGSIRKGDAGSEVESERLVRSLRGLAREIVMEQVRLVDLLGEPGPKTADGLAIMRDHFVHIYQASLEAMRQIDDPTLVEEPH